MPTERRLAHRGYSSETDHLAAHIERMWGQLRRGYPDQPQFSLPVLKPPVDIYQTADSVVVIVEIPGIRDQEVWLEVETDRLRIHGEKRNRHCSGEHLYSQMEITCGQFERSLDLPSPIDPQRTSLRYDDGYIEIRLPRVQRQTEQHLRIVVRQP
ncbi:MAG: Hsp20/alpha crystallin family protein [Dehalococcoidia bacterium]